MLARILGAATLACVSSFTAAAQQSLVTIHDVNVHKAAKTASEVVTTVDSGTTVSFLSRRTHYDHVELPDGTKGWIYERFLTEAGDATSSPTPAPSHAAPSVAASSGGMANTIAAIEALPKVDATEA